MLQGWELRGALQAVATGKPCAQIATIWARHAPQLPLLACSFLLRIRNRAEAMQHQSLAAN